ncbi:MAG TPA: glycosyltransferase family 2 protein [Terriglobales bacterium]|nr:glycosyltransferase family 2 protein [Terriglobales bacterium]
MPPQPPGPPASRRKQPSSAAEDAAAPLVSVVVPARNEEISIGECLASLTDQNGVSCEIIVVDDDSSDATGEVARSFPGVKVIAAGPLPAGWSGKSNACATGARQARGKWLLFTDADTVHLPGSLARAVAEAENCGADLLSYSPEQVTDTVWGQAVMPVIFAELAGTYRPREVSDPASAAAAANGQYLLITREAYDAVGGHAAAATTLLEDVELARRVKRSGRHLQFRFGGDAVRTRMYRSFEQLREGWTKNLALLFPEAEELAARRGLEFAAIVGGAAVGAWAAASGRRGLAIASGALAAAAYGNFRRRIHRAHAGGRAETLALLGLPLFAYLLRRSAQRYAGEGEVTWKGRSYSAQTAERLTAGEGGFRGPIHEAAGPPNSSVMSD